MDNEYGSMFKRLMNERNELRKYIIDICNLLYIDTSQSVLGANCLEFYAVLCSTAENKIRGLQEQLKRKQNELEELRQYHNKCCQEFEKEKKDLIAKYNQLSINCDNGDYCNTEQCSLLKSKEEECEKYKQTLTKIIRFLKEDKKFARYSGYPIVLTSIVIEEIEKILKENDIKISEVKND